MKDLLPYIRLRSPTSSACISNVPTHFIRLRGSEHSDELRWELELGLDHDLDLNIGHKELDQRNPLRNRKSQPHWLCPLLPFFCPSPAFAYGTTVATGGGTSVYAGSASVAAFAYGQSVSAAVFPETDGEYQ